MEIINYIKEKISNQEYSILPDTIAIGQVYKITEFGSLDVEGYEKGYLYLPIGSGIKKHTHINDIEKYTKIQGVLSVFGIKQQTNTCFINESHCIDIVNEDTIIKTFKISKEYLKEIPNPQSEDIFELLENKIHQKNIRI